MASGDLSLTSNSSQEESPDYVGFTTERVIRPSSNSSGSTTANINNNPSNKKYDVIKQQYEQAVIDLSSLQREHSDTLQRCEEMESQLGFYKNRYVAAMNQLETSNKERTIFPDVTTETNCRPTVQQQKQFDRQFRMFLETMKPQEKENGNNQSSFSYYEHYPEISNKKCEGGCVESEKLREEMKICQKLYTDLSKQRHSLSVEKDNLHLQLSKAYSELEKAKRDINLYRDARNQLIAQQDKELEEMKALMAARANELLMTKIDRGRVEEELNTLLSEKDNVLQETQKMSDDLQAVKKELDVKKKEEMKMKNEMKNLQQTNLDLLQKLEQLNIQLEKRELLKSRESNWSKEFSESKDDFKEIEKLRKALEKAREEVDTAVQEIETAKSRRDWAISEREKIVQERDSVKTLCDELRKERDKAISDLLSAIRDSEKIKKQKDEAHKEIDSLKEQIEAQSSNSRRSYRWSCPPMEFDEVIEVELSNFHKDEDIGIILDDSSNRLLVCGVSNTSPAFGKLKTNDVIIKVNELDCRLISKRSAVEAIRNSAPRCELLIGRAKQSKRHLYTVHLNMIENRNHGLSLESGVFVSKIQPNSLASFEPKLDVGDRILGINNKSMEGIQSMKDVTKILDDPRNDSLTIFALKNIQDVSYGDVKRRMTNTSAQTDSADSVHKGSLKQTSKFSGVLNMFKGRMHLSKSGTDPDHFSQENDAIAALDSVLSENSEKSKDYNIMKRSKKKKDSKDASKSMGTWPRATPVNTSQENPTGTIVQNRKKDRPTLTIFNGPISVDKVETENYFKPVVTTQPQQPSSARTSNNATTSSLKQSNPNRNSNPIPAKLFPSNTPSMYSHRHSVYTAPVEPDPVLLEQSKPMPNVSSRMNPNLRLKMPESSLKYGPNHRHHTHSQNRHSINLTPSFETGSGNYKSSGQPPQQQQAPGQQNSMDFISKKDYLDNINFKTNQPYNFTGTTQQNSLDVISLKSQNSIDSFLSQKSPPVHDYPVMYTKRSGHKNVSKYPSDSESIGMENVILPATHAQSPSTTTMAPSSLLFSSNISSSSAPRYTPFYPSFGGHIHPHPHRIRHSSPLTSAHSMDHQNINTASGLSSTDKLEIDYLPPSTHHAYNVSVDYPYNRSRNQPTRDHEDGPANFYHVYEGGTFPRKKEHQRFRIPSNPSVTSKGSGVKNSTGSIEHHGSERGSPMPPVHVDILSHGANNSKRNSNVPDCLCPGDLRRVTIDKSDKPLGITIQCNNNGGGIFVSTVLEKSIASRAGLQVGDQLLEVCGINMRSATKDIAANVLRQCGNSITMLVQYNPEKYDGNALDQEGVSHSGSPTPRNSPRPARNLPLQVTSPPQSPLTVAQPLPQVPPSSHATSQIKSQKFTECIEHQSDSSPHGSLESIFEEEPRLVTLPTDKSKNLGIKLFGGNKVGIFVHDVQPGSPADLAGIRKGDQILEYNNVDLRRVTAEQAANEISRLMDNTKMLVQNNLQKFNQIQDKAGDSFYIRVGFDRTGDLAEDELRFLKDEVLYVDNTIFRGVFGQWRAWKLGPEGVPKECGIIPSQSKVEEELRLIGDTTDGEGSTTRRGSTSARRSFFRRKKHQRSSSRDSKELASFSNTQLSYFSDSGMLNDEGTVMSYQRVERLDYPVCRPVLVLGPLAKCVTDRVTVDFPMLFQHCHVTQMNCSPEAMEEGLQKNIFVDYRPKGNIFECVTVQSIRNICENNRHCVLDVSISAIERLQRLQIYPIVLLLKFKSAKQIKEIKDSRYSTDKITAKAAKDMYERSLTLETDYKAYISAVISAGVNITHMSTQIMEFVMAEQSRVLWVPVSNA